MRPNAAIFLLMFLPVVLSGQPAKKSPSLLGRCPVENIVSIISGRFVTPDVDDVLGVQDLGRIRLSMKPGRERNEVQLCRLVLLRLAGKRFQKVWQSRSLLASTVPRAGLAANAWTSADINADGRPELFIFGAESCQVISFNPDSIRTREFNLHGSWITDAVSCDINADSVPEIVTLELSPLDTLLDSRLLRVYAPTDSCLVPISEYITGLDWGKGINITLTGAGRLEDYWTDLPVLAGTYTSIRPSIYAVLYPVGPDSFAFTNNPFPWHEWFTKEQVLPADKLTLFNVGDTLVAYGYFVPGSRPSGPSKSFAALQDGEWRLLPISEKAQHITGPVCRFNLNQVSGWLELRDHIFRFYPTEVFHWRKQPSH